MSASQPEKTAGIPPQSAFLAIQDDVLEGCILQVLTLAHLERSDDLQDARLVIADHPVESAIPVILLDGETAFRAGSLLDQIKTILSGSTRHYASHLTIQGHDFYPADMMLTLDNGTDVRLTEKERDILHYLYMQEGDDVTRADLLGAVWGYAEGLETHTLETHLYRLRQKIEQDPSAPDIVLTTENGYRLVR